jgi:hypothetical protein
MMRQTLPILLLIVLTACTGKAHKQVNNTKKESISLRTQQDENIHLPPNTSSEEITELFASRSKYPNTILIGIEKWKFRKDTYIAVIKSMPDDDADYSIDNEQLFVGMIDASSDLKIISISDNLSNMKIDWNHTLIHRPDPDGEFEDSIDKTNVIYKLNEFSMQTDLNVQYPMFDFHKFQISKDEFAFGIRFEAWNGFSGGGNGYFVLLLFRNETNVFGNIDKIKCIFAQPMKFYEFYRACFEPGCEDHYHDEWEGENILYLLPSLTNGFYDLQVRKKKYVNNMGEKYPKNWKMNFHWDADSASYQPVI